MKLHELLQTDDYAGLSVEGAAELANTRRHAITVDAYHTYRSLASGSGIGVEPTRRLIQTLDAASQADPLISEIRHSLRGERGINVNDPSTQGMLALLAGDSDLPLTSGDVNAIVALTVGAESDVQRHGLGTIEAKHVDWVREGIRPWL